MNIDIKKHLNLVILAALFVVALGVALFFYIKESKAHSIVATKLDSTFDELKRLRDKGTTVKRVDEIEEAVKEVTTRFKSIHETMLDWHDKPDTMSGTRFQGHLRAQAGIISDKAKRDIVFITEDVRFLGLKSVDEAIPSRAEVPGLMKKLSASRDVVKLLIANKVLTIDSLVFTGSEDIGSTGSRARAGRVVAPGMGGSGMQPGGGSGAGGAARPRGGGLYEKISFQVVFTATYPVMTSFLSDLTTPPSQEEDPRKKLSNFLIVKNLSIAPVDPQSSTRSNYDVARRPTGTGGRTGLRQPATRGPAMRPDMGIGMGRGQEDNLPKRRKKKAPEGTRFPVYNVLQVTAEIDMIDLTQQFLDVLDPPRRRSRGMGGPGGTGRGDPYGPQGGFGGQGGGPGGRGGYPGGNPGIPGGRR